MTYKRDYCIVCQEPVPPKRHGWSTCSIECGKERQRRGITAPQWSHTGPYSFKLGTYMVVGDRRENQAGVARSDKCDICNGDNNGRKMVFDHDHNHCLKGCRNCFRGWICGNCNCAAGMAADDPDLLRDIANYIECFATGAPYNLGSSEPKRVIQRFPGEDTGLLSQNLSERCLTAEADRYYLESLWELTSDSRVA